MARSSLSSSLAPEQQKSAPTTTTTTTTTTHQNENITKQEIKCICPPNSEAYILKHHVYKTAEGQLGYRYYFACSPETVSYSSILYIYVCVCVWSAKKKNPKSSLHTRV